MKRLGAILLVAVATLATACSSPRVTEDSAAECANRVDDDGDGYVDCADSKCIAAGRCESGGDACANGVDDDGNGRTDCEDQTCIDGGFCEPRAMECTVDPQDGCVRGLVCSAAGQETKGTLCALPGIIELHRTCDAQGSCQPGLHCHGYCKQICQANGDCPAETFCVRSARTKFGWCSVACVPALQGAGCPIGTCIALSSFEARFDDQDVGAVCGDPITWRGRVGEGGECQDPASVNQLDGMCEPDLVCFPTPGGSPRCRRTCAITQEGFVTVDCPPGRRCGRAFPFDRRPPLQSQLFLGICEP